MADLVLHRKSDYVLKYQITENGTPVDVSSATDIELQIYSSCEATLKTINSDVAELNIGILSFTLTTSDYINLPDTCRYSVTLLDDSINNLVDTGSCIVYC